VKPLLTLIPFIADDANYLRLGDLFVATHPHLPRRSVDQLRFAYEERQRYAQPHGHLVCAGADRLHAVVDWFKPTWAPDHLLIFAIAIHPAHQRRGHGVQLLAKVVEAALAAGFTTVGTQAYDTHPVALRWLARFGFEAAMTCQWTRLDLTRPLPEPVERTYRQVLANGVEIIDGEALQARFPDDWAARWHAIEGAVELDIPSPVAPEVLTLEAWRRRCATPDWRALNFHFAVEGDQVVGMSGGTICPAEPTTAGVRLTGTLRSHRRRGIATALKVAACHGLRRQGVARIITQNERNNPMLDINLALGFEPSHTDSVYKASVVDLAAKIAGQRGISAPDCDD
jgi:GNAT superfamily N-acetyltransferase